MLEGDREEEEQVAHDIPRDGDHQAAGCTYPSAVSSLKLLVMMVVLCLKTKLSALCIPKEGK